MLLAPAAGCLGRPALSVRLRLGHSIREGVDRPLHPCAQPGCPALTRDARCPDHAQLHTAQYDQSRGSPASRGYDYQWELLRLHYLATHPSCEARNSHTGEPCGSSKSLRVHHRRPLRQGGARLDYRNLVTLCERHHRMMHGQLNHIHGG